MDDVDITEDEWLGEVIPELEALRGNLTKKSWTAAEVQVVRRYHKEVRHSDIAKYLGRSVSSINHAVSTYCREDDAN